MSKLRTIDTHTHILTQETAALLSKGGVEVTITPDDAEAASLDVKGTVHRPFPTGGFTPYQAARWEHGWAVRPEPKKNVSVPPENISGRFFYDTILHSAPALEFMIGHAGADRVLLGSDYPYDMGTPDCVAHVRSLRIPEADKASILGGRAETLLSGRAS
jgi:predicted TIM-barrel fold metal-dependent hydrolase